MEYRSDFGTPNSHTGDETHYWVISFIKVLECFQSCIVVCSTGRDTSREAIYLPFSVMARCPIEPKIKALLKCSRIFYTSFCV